MRQLQADKLLVALATRLGGTRTQLCQQAGHGRARVVVGIEIQLSIVGAAVALHSERFATPDQRGTRTAEVAPAPQRQVRRATIDGTVPAFHRVARKTIAEGLTMHFDRLRQRAAGLDVCIDLPIGIDALEVCRKVSSRSKVAGGLEPHTATV